MPDYSIFALGESEMTIDGAQLDGVSQGNGSHLVNATITLDSASWEEIQVTDTNSNFQDGGNQRLNGAQSFDGTSYADNTRLEAEYSIVLSDGTNTWTAIGFNITNSSPAYGTVEGLAFIGGVGGFPPIGVELTVISSAEGPSFDQASYATPICYARGTEILTIDGWRRIEMMRAGDLVETADNGPCPVRWVGGRQVLGVGRFAPVEITAGVLGAHRPMRVSQQHRVAIGSPMAELLFGSAEVFVPAIHLVDDRLVRLSPGAAIDYFHLYLDRHEVIFANGVASESMFLGDLTRPGNDLEALVFFEAAMPDPAPRVQLARRSLRRYETAAMLAAMGGLCHGSDAAIPLPATCFVPRARAG